ncbi:MAG: sigma-54-dependent Fis family transcriptional regulator [Chloroflexi bacterium]|nr:sigma-54-dependent Fis family transcriptional regulator [Chloroflexota bacterium]
MDDRLPTSLWFCVAGNCPAHFQATLIDALQPVGVSAQLRDPQDTDGSGLVCFATPTEAVCDLVREASRGGAQRVLAIATSRQALDHDSAWRMLQAGAADVFAWDAVNNPAAVIAARLRRWQAVDQLLQSPLVRNNLVGRSPAWLAVLRQIVEVARFTDAPILITGETGTGKELLARLVHTLDLRRSKRDLIVLDCTTIVPELSGSEFFGHERGAFTGAVAARDGAFALADGGTLFLDEVGDLPPALQAQLLRVIQEHTYKRLGSNTWQRTDFRLVCATNRDLIGDDSRVHFRRDLYYRIASWTCHVPPLRERAADIMSLARHFAQQHAPDRPAPDFDAAVQEYLLKRDYTGNIRDLKQLVSRLMYRHVGPGPITPGDIPEAERTAPVAGDEHNALIETAIRQALDRGTSLKEIRTLAEDTAIRLTLADENDNVPRAARKLGVTDRALQLRRAARRSQTSDARAGE